MPRVLFFIVFLWLGTVYADVITSFDPHGKKEVALTFDACETRTPSYFDPVILEYLLANKIPATFFVSAKFALRNPKELAEVSRYPFIEIENHSYHHYAHMESLSKEKVVEEIMSTQNIIKKASGRKTKYFRFPAGNYDKKTLDTVESLGYKIVHWSFSSGDPDKNIPAERIIKWVTTAAKPGSILIFHINGRGYTTPKTLPVIVGDLKRRGYRFVRLDEVL
ncbi:polysaccharide deacetylase family protein [Sulfurimonas sp. HSL-1716]|uniref:polysaccharide deacetylase family protein n=1 Tax=Hydrocurvibacter sulfurireducens TaxID=3131937 RepID=UPI0031F8C1EE